MLSEFNFGSHRSNLHIFSFLNNTYGTRNGYMAFTIKLIGAVFVVLLFPWKINLDYDRTRRLEQIKLFQSILQRLPLAQKGTSTLLILCSFHQAVSPKLYQVHGMRTCPMAILERLSNAAIYQGAGWCMVGFSVKTNYISKVPVEFSIGNPLLQYKCC